ncbi:S49 family peptidase [Paracoccus marcusii]|nr:S49 family peptidase [Paracoccus marcusii]
MNGMMAVVHSVDRTHGLDLIIHTPGGGIEATRALVEYLYLMFADKDIRVIVPHMAMSAGTMIACAAKSIVMGKHSCLGPTDPHINGAPAMGILAEVDDAIVQIRADPLKQIIYQQVFAKYPPAFIGDCQRAVEISRQMVQRWLTQNMLQGNADPLASSQAIVAELTNYKGTASHSHHFLAGDCKAMGLEIAALEDDQDLQEAVLSVHHAFVATFAQSDVIKIIQNSDHGIWTINANT